MQEIFDDLVARMKPPTGKNFRLDVPPEGAVNMFRHIAENADFYRVALGEKGIASFLARVRAFLCEVSARRMLQLQPDKKNYRIPLEVVASHSAGAMIGLTVWWVNNGMPISPEAMAEDMMMLSAMGTYWAIRKNLLAHDRAQSQIEKIFSSRPQWKNQPNCSRFCASRSNPPCQKSSVSIRIPARAKIRDGPAEPPAERMRRKRGMKVEPSVLY
jgi:hypothetical protein